MLLAQEIANATGHSDLLTLSLAVVTAAGVALREIFAFFTKQKRTDEYADLHQQLADLQRQLDEFERQLRLSEENKLRIAELGRGLDEIKGRVESVTKHGQEVRDIVISVRAIVDSWGTRS
jgi:uncharacterized protein HemX